MTLDTICQMTTRPSTLNALHACRPSHPMGRGNKYKWRNAWWLAVQDRQVNGAATDWLEKQAKAEEAGR